MTQFQIQPIVEKEEFYFRLTSLDIAVFSICESDINDIYKYKYVARVGIWELEYADNELIAYTNRNKGLRRFEAELLKKSCNDRVRFTTNSSDSVFAHFYHWITNGPTVDKISFHDLDGMVEFIHFVRRLLRHYW